MPTHTPPASFMYFGSSGTGGRERVSCYKADFNTGARSSQELGQGENTAMAASSGGTAGSGVCRGPGGTGKVGKISLEDTTKLLGTR